MLNQVVMVGRLTKDVELKSTENNKKYANITLAIPRSYKNEDGEYDTDFVPLTIWNGVAENTANYCHKGDIIGVKGNISTDKDKIYITGEKITFLTSKKD